MQFTAGVPLHGAEQRILPSAFDADIGRSIPLRVGDRIVGTAVVKAVCVEENENGQSVYVTLDLPKGLVMSALDAMTAQSPLFAPFRVGGSYASE